MTQKQLNTLTMCKAVLAHIDSKPAVWNNFAPIVAIVDNFRSTVEALSQQNMLQAERTTVGYTKDKDMQMTVMCNLTYQLLLKIRSYARIMNNQVLLYAINYSESQLQRGRETEVINRCQLIHDKGQEYLANLADFLVTPDLLSELQRAIDNFKPLSAKRDMVAGERITATANIPTLLKTVREELRKLDDLMAGLVTDKNFINTYTQVRYIIDRGGKSEGEAKKDKQTV
jgi:hypothetical protein